MSDEVREGGDGESSGSADGRSWKSQLLRPRQWRRYTRYPFLLAKLLFFTAFGVVVYWFVDLVGDVLFPIVLSLVIAYLLDPLIDWFEERGVSRTIGILVVLLCAGVGITLFVLVFYPMIVAQVDRVGEQAPKLVDLVENRLIPWIEATFDYELPATISEGLDEYGQSLGENVPTIANQVGAWLGNIATGTGAFVVGLINIVMIPVFSFFFLRDFDRMRLKTIEFIPERHREPVLARLDKMDRIVGGWVRGQLQVAAILAVLYAIGLSVAFQLAGVEITSGVAIGILAGLGNAIPYVGTAIGIVMSVLIVLINWSGLGPLIAVGLVFTVVQTLEGYLITPQIVGENVGLTPVTVIIVLLIGGEIYGLLGFIFAVPIFGALTVLLPDLVAYYKSTPFFTGRRPVPLGDDEEGERRDDGEE